MVLELHLGRKIDAHQWLGAGQMLSADKKLNKFNENFQGSIVIGVTLTCSSRDRRSSVLCLNVDRNELLLREASTLKKQGLQFGNWSRSRYDYACNIVLQAIKRFKEHELNQRLHSSADFGVLLPSPSPKKQPAPGAQLDKESSKQVQQLHDPIPDPIPLSVSGVSHHQPLTSIPQHGLQQAEEHQVLATIQEFETKYLNIKMQAHIQQEQQQMLTSLQELQQSVSSFRLFSEQCGTPKDVLQRLCNLSAKILELRQLLERQIGQIAHNQSPTNTASSVTEIKNPSYMEQLVGEVVRSNNITAQLASRSMMMMETVTRTNMLMQQQLMGYNANPVIDLTPTGQAFDLDQMQPRQPYTPAPVLQVPPTAGTPGQHQQPAQLQQRGRHPSMMNSNFFKNIF